MDNRTADNQAAQHEWNQSTKPTAGTVFMRTFLPYQLWRFAWINWKMLGIMRRSHHDQ